MFGLLALASDENDEAKQISDQRNEEEELEEEDPPKARHRHPSR